ncbi:MAG: UDP-galactopyranose mutase [Firmicutes bacterium]|nr:UDP-galactopyranose mutase [Bacillota bacterium]
MIDYLIVGAGFAGCVLAERIANDLNRQVLIVETRNHIGGNAYDYYNESGILVHKYGAHAFHTNNKKVFDYLSQFTEWNLFQLRVTTNVDGQKLPIPINLDTINGLYGFHYNEEDLKEFWRSVAQPEAELNNSEDVIISKVGSELFEKFYKNYTKKQWDLSPSTMDKSVCSRIPVRTNRDNRYFTDKYQVVPKDGYTKMFEKLIAHPNIHLLLQTDFRDIRESIPFKKLIYTGPIDVYFDHQFGKLPYRSLKFSFETFDREYYQKTAIVNYPNDNDFTRIIEFKRLTGQLHPKTTIAYEYPSADGEPYYPIPRADNFEIYNKYKAEADKLANVWFAGRLGSYRYYNMDQVVDQALTLFESQIKPLYSG